jgi:cobalt-zinc-cadmium efflux system membrane fusion protein
MKRQLIVAAPALTLILLLFPMPGCSEGEAEIVERVDTISGPRPVRVAQVEKRDFRPTVRTTGTLVPRRHGDVYALVPGELENLPVDIGSRVRRGALLFSVRQVDYELAMQRAEASLAEAEVGVTAAQRELTRLENLFAEGSATDQMRDQAATEHDRALAAREQALAARAQAAQALEDSSVRAPYGGVITHRFMEPGEYVGAGDPVVEIMDLSLLNAELELPERYAGLVPVGSAVSLTFEHRDDVVDGKVTRVNPKVDVQTRTFVIKVEVDNRDGLLQAGLFCSASFSLPVQSDQVAVPRAALLRDEGRTRVWVVEDGTVSSQEIVEGTALNGWVLVRSGLYEGDVVVIEGGGGLVDGGAVIVEQ